MNKKTPEQPYGPRTGWLKNSNPPCDLQALPRCQATAKSTGERCGNPAMKGKRVCYIHGGRSPGAPKKNRNAWKTGEYSESVREENKRFRAFMADCNALLDSVLTK